MSSCFAVCRYHWDWWRHCGRGCRFCLSGRLHHRFKHRISYLLLKVYMVSKNLDFLHTLQAMAQLQQNIPMAGAQMLTSSQAATLLGSQPLYIRTAGPIQGQQYSNIQTVTSAQLKGKVDGQRNVQVLKVVFLALFYYARYSKITTSQ